MICAGIGLLGLFKMLHQKMADPFRIALSRFVGFGFDPLRDFRIDRHFNFIHTLALHIEITHRILYSCHINTACSSVLHLSKYFQFFCILKFFTFTHANEEETVYISGVG